MFLLTGSAGNYTITAFSIVILAKNPCFHKSQR